MRGKNQLLFQNFFIFLRCPADAVCAAAVFGLPAALLPTVFCRLRKVFLFFGGADKYFLRRVPLRGFLKFFCYYIVIINFLLYN